MTATAYLIAQGKNKEQRWRRRLPAERDVTLGRASGVWSVDWDNRISRQHVRLQLERDGLRVERLPQAINPVFFQGRADDQFVVRSGDHFVIGETAFTFTNDSVHFDRQEKPPITEQTYSQSDLQAIRFRDADRRIEVLSRLPEIVSGCATDNELYVRFVSVVLSAVRHATAAALVAVQRADNGQPRVEVLHWDRRGDLGRDFSPSMRLILRTIEQGESTAYAWTDETIKQAAAFTQTDEADWAFCVPISSAACPEWALYVSGRFARPDGGSTLDSVQLGEDVKFAELAAGTLGSLRKIQLLERKDASLRQFFSPVVLEALSERDPEQILTPREVDVSVLFCDLRGFSRRSELAAGDLLGLLHRVSGALGVMTHHILAEGGVVGDFHGDAAMGFWGWPLPQDDAVECACRAALSIRAEFAAAAEDETHPLADFRVGIGIATGRAVAGKIGTVDQVKVTVFGPVVNLAARLEAMTKYLRASMLLDARTAAEARRRISPSVARVRRVARVRPYGLESAVEVSELLPPSEQYPQLTDQDITAYEDALEALQQGAWSRAFALLHKVPAEDRVKDFLTVFIAQNNRTPPAHWDGVIPLDVK